MNTHPFYTVVVDESVPEDIAAYARYLQSLFWLHDWEITLCIEPLTDQVRKDGTFTGGYVDITEPSMIAGIALIDEDGKMDSLELKRRLLHEFIHIALAHILHANETLRMLLPTRLHSFTEAYSIDAMERTVARLTYVFAGLLDDKTEGKADER